MSFDEFAAAVKDHAAEEDPRVWVRLAFREFDQRQQGTWHALVLELNEDAHEPVRMCGSSSAATGTLLCAPCVCMCACVRED